jgi:tetratricopeptide (TPR) repeat protein
MSEASFEAVRIADLERPDGWSPIRQALGVQSFGINAWTAHEAGANIIPEHDERPSQHEELYLVTAGHAVFDVEGERIDAPAGTIVFVREPAATRAAVAEAPDTTVVSVGGEPGRAFTPQSWEMYRDVIARFDDGRFADAKQMLLDALDRYEDRSSVLYNLACAEAQLGELDHAIGHLGEALNRRPALAEGAAADDDLAALRADPRFQSLLG